LDYVLVRGRFFSAVEDVRAYRGTALPTDHRLVVARLRLHLKSHRKPPQIKRFDTLRLRIPAVYEKFKRELSSRLEGYPEDLPEGTEDAWAKIETALKGAGEASVGFRKRKHLCYISQRTLELTEEKRRSSVMEERKALTKQIRRSLRRDEHSYWTATAAECETAFERGHTQKLFATIQSLTKKRSNVSDAILDKEGNNINSRSGQVARWQEHFEELLNKPPPSAPDNQLTSDANAADATDQISTLLPSRAEIRNAIISLKNGKSPGPDGIPPEFYKSGVNELVPVLHRLISNIWENGKAPATWQETILIPVFKKGDAKRCSNYRGISLLPIAGKLLSGIILKRLSAHLDSLTPDTQAGFRAGRSTMDNIFILRQVLERRREYNLDTIVAFLDYSAAFDSVDQASLWSMLKASGIPIFFINMIRGMYEDSVCRVRVYGELSEPFKIRSGVRQGDILSPLLFLRAVEWVTSHACRASDGVTAGENLLVSHLEYADDLALLEENAQRLQLAVDRIKDCSAGIGLLLNVAKCKNISSAGNQAPVTIDNVPVETVKQFNYLGSTIDPSGDIDTEIAARLGKASGAFKAISKATFSRRQLSTRVKLRLFNALIMPILLYGLETVALTVGNLRKLEAFENFRLRTILRIDWRDNITNRRVYQMAGKTGSLRETIRLRRLKWLGHISRRGEGNLVHSCFFSNIPPNWRRRPGGQKLSWRRVVETDVEEKMRIYSRMPGFNWNEMVKEQAASRSQWKAFIMD
jgi:hypothetical protein